LVLLTSRPFCSAAFRKQACGHLFAGLAFSVYVNVCRRFFSSHSPNRSGCHPARYVFFFPLPQIVFFDDAPSHRLALLEREKLTLRLSLLVWRFFRIGSFNPSAISPIGPFFRHARFPPTNVFFLLPPQPPARDPKPRRPPYVPQSPLTFPVCGPECPSPFSPICKAAPVPPGSLFLPPSVSPQGLGPCPSLFF